MMHACESSGARRDSAHEDAGTLSGLRPMRIDYDETRTAEERSTYRSPFHLPFDFLVDIHPITRLKSIRARAERRR